MSDEHLRCFWPYFAPFVVPSIWFIGRLLHAYHRTQTCLRLRLLCLVTNGVGGTPPLLFGGCIIKTKGYFWSIWVQNLFSWFFRAYTILYRYTGLQHCSAAPPRSRQKYSEIGRIPGFLMVWEKSRAGGTPPSLFLGQRIQRILEFLSKIPYRQVHWCAALFCRTSPEQPKIPQKRPNFRVSDFFGQHSGRRKLPPILGP